MKSLAKTQFSDEIQLQIQPANQTAEKMILRNNTC